MEKKNKRVSVFGVCVTVINVEVAPSLILEHGPSSVIEFNYSDKG